MSLFAQIFKHQICLTVILIAFEDLSRRDTHKDILRKKEKVFIEPCLHHHRIHASYIIM